MSANALLKSPSIPHLQDYAFTQFQQADANGTGTMQLQDVPGLMLSLVPGLQDREVRETGCQQCVCVCVPMCKCVCMFVCVHVCVCDLHGPVA